MKHHEQWKLDGKYEPLPEPVSEAGRSLTPEEEVRLIDTAKSNPHWAVAYHATILENETGMRGVEVRNLQVKRIDLATGEIRLQKSKTKGGVRTIPLSTDALDSIRELLKRAHNLGATDPDHYLIPALVRRKKVTENGVTVWIRRHDPTQPIKSWRTAWRKLTVKAGLRGLRGHDLRHNWVTSHAEIGTPQSVLEAQAGHLSSECLTTTSTSVRKLLGRHRMNWRELRQSRGRRLGRICYKTPACAPAIACLVPSRSRMFWIQLISNQRSFSSCKKIRKGKAVLPYKFPYMDPDAYSVYLQVLQSIGRGGVI